MTIDTQALKKFILESSRATYAAGDAAKKEKKPDGSTTICYESGPYKYHDNYFGGEPYGGREVVFLNEKPIWMMVYYGLVHEGSDLEDVYPFLMECLSNSTVDIPYRGPASYARDVFTYENKFDGSVEHFSGTEKIFQSGTLVYEASYIGGLVDQIGE
jgi:hypothetical protein